MSIRRACSYTGTFTLPDAADSYNALVVAISQNKQMIINRWSLMEVIRDDCCKN